MDAKKIINFWKLFAGLLVMLNITLCVFVWFTHQQDAARHREQPFEFVIRKLQLNDAQITEYTKLRNDHHDSMMILQQAGNELKKQLFSHLKGDTISSAQNDSVGNAIGQNQKQIEMVTYRHFEKIKMLCDPQQEKIFDEIMDDLLLMLSERHGPPPGNDMRPPHGMPPPEDDNRPEHS